MLWPEVPPNTNFLHGSLVCRDVQGKVSLGKMETQQIIIPFKTNQGLLSGNKKVSVA